MGCLEKEAGLEELLQIYFHHPSCSGSGSRANEPKVSSCRQLSLLKKHNLVNKACSNGIHKEREDAIRRDTNVGELF
jgi:hypothetical protein